MGAREDLSIVIRGSTEQLANDLARGASLLRSFAKSVEQNSPKAVVKADESAIGAFKRTAAAASEARAGITGAASSLAGFGAKVVIAGGSLLALEAGFAGVSGVIGILKSSVSMAAEVEQNTIAFETFLGSAEKTATVMADLRKFAADTPFSSKDVTDGAKQLLAYGFAAQDIIPSLRTIGTLAAATGKPLGELVYNVGTTRVQGHATQLDINQLTGKGIDVYPGLAKELKVDQSEVRKSIEEGRADWNTYKQVLVDLGNTRYAGLLEKQADSLKGSWEQLTDGFDKAKLKLGQVIAQEAGLRGAAKGLESFASQLEHAIDSDSFRGGVRLVADLVKGGAQIAYEFGRAGVAVASINLDGLTKSSPEIALLATNAKAFVAGLQNFKLDKRAVAEMAFGLFDMIATPLADAADFANVEGKAFASGIDKNFVQPLKNFARTTDEVSAAWKDSWMQTVWNLPDKGIDAAKRAVLPADLRAAREQSVRDREFLRDRQVPAPASFEGMYSYSNDRPFASQMRDAHGLKWMADIVKFTTPDKDNRTYLDPSKGDESAEALLHRARLLANLTHNAELIVGKGGQEQLRPHLDALYAKQEDFYRPFTARPEDIHERNRIGTEMLAGRLPDRRPDYKQWEPPPPAPAGKSIKETLAEIRAGLRAPVFSRIAEGEIGAHFKEMFGSINKAQSQGRMVADQLPFGSAFGPLANLTPGLIPPPEGKPSMYLPGLDTPPQHLVNLAHKLNPAHDLKEKLAEFDKLSSLGGLGANKDQIEKGRAELIRDVAEKMGIGGGKGPELAGAAMVGSNEDAKLIAKFRAGGDDGKQGVEGLLQRILEELQKNRMGDLSDIIRDANDAIAGVAQANP